jgi:hypothetical protein
LSWVPRDRGERRELADRAGAGTFRRELFYMILIHALNEYDRLMAGCSCNRTALNIFAYLCLIGYLSWRPIGLPLSRYEAHEPAVVFMLSTATYSSEVLL